MVILSVSEQWNGSTVVVAKFFGSMVILISLAGTYSDDGWVTFLRTILPVFFSLLT